MAYGVLDTGFSKKPLEIVKSTIEGKQLAQISPDLDLTTDSPVGQLNGIISAELAELWDLGEAIYASQDPDQAQGEGLDAVAAITGTVRDAATRSRASCTVNLNAGTTITANVHKAAPLGNPSALFHCMTTTTNSGGVAANFTVAFEADATGPIVANAGTLTVIMTPVSGWNSITNPLDAARGTDVELDSPLRLKREDELQAEGSAPVDAIRADLLRVPGVISCSVLENVTDVPDGNGLPPHSVEALIFDGVSPTVSNDLIAQTLWGNGQGSGRAGGIRTNGGTPGNAVDTVGATHVMNFSRVAQRTVYFTFDIRIDASTFPGSGDTLIKQAIVAKGAVRNPDEDVILASFYAAIFGVPGVTDIVVFRAAFTATPVGLVNLVVALREIATFDTSRIILNHV